MKVTKEIFDKVRAKLAAKRKNGSHRTIADRVGVSEATVRNISLFVDYEEYKAWSKKQCAKIKQPSKQLKLKVVKEDTKKFENPIPVYDEVREAPPITKNEYEQVIERIEQMIKTVERLDEINNRQYQNMVTMLKSQHEDYIKALNTVLEEKRKFHLPWMN